VDAANLGESHPKSHPVSHSKSHSMSHSSPPVSHRTLALAPVSPLLSWGGGISPEVDLYPFPHVDDVC
jgi:hypothetical protein